MKYCDAGEVTYLGRLNTCFKVQIDMARSCVTAADSRLQPWAFHQMLADATPPFDFDFRLTLIREN